MPPCPAVRARPSAAGRIRFAAVVLLGTLATACSVFEPAPAPPAAATPRPAVEPPALASYLALLDRLAPGDPARQAAALAEARAQWQLAPDPPSTLRYAFALGAAGREGSDPAEAARLIGELLAAPGALAGNERQFAAALQREFDARAQAAAEFAQQRTEDERRAQQSGAELQKRLDALAAENARLKRTLAQAERKLQAITEMERSLSEQAEDLAPEPQP